MALVACALSATATARADTAPANGAAYTAALSAAAQKLDTAAPLQRTGVHVPDVHVPPAPLPGPPRFSPSLDDWLQNDLTAVREEKNAKSRAQMLRDAAASLRGAARASAAIAASDPAHQIGPTLASILAQPAYHEAESKTEATPKKSWWDLFLEWLADLIRRLFGGLFSAATGLPWLGQVIIYATLAALAALLVYVAIRLARYLMVSRRAREIEDAGELLERETSAQELLDVARAAAARGEYALAISLLFRAALRRLDAVGMVPYDAARTAGEYRRAVRRASSQASAPFDSLAQTFTIATYANAEIGEQDWNKAGDAYGQFVPVVERGQRKAAA